MSGEEEAPGTAAAAGHSSVRPRRSACKPSETEYFASHGAALGFPDPLERGKRIYDFNLSGARNYLQLDGLMGELTAFLVELASDYAGGRPELLYYPAKPTDLQLLVKPYASMLTKVYRINCLQNRNYPAAPRDGLVEYATLYSHPKMNDLIRTRLVCKYMDGPRFVAEGIEHFCERREFGYRSYPMHSETGYHAWHCYIRTPVDMAVGDAVEARDIWLELQVTTQLAESITALTHGLYETNRTSVSDRSSTEWRWNPRTQQFRSAYLGHTLHLLEGIIQTFRDEVLGLEPPFAEGEKEAGKADAGRSAPGATDNEDVAQGGLDADIAPLPPESDGEKAAGEEAADEDATDDSGEPAEALDDEDERTS
ncbi:hypothetical protein [Sphingosinicella xenopeptidilytica]|uniref:Uncharacterized protein n=1 Tax=Sphingosinicella xenopeptidilytica TaxID=364098 RepID=A0ABW3CAG5_SPHXN